MITFRKAALGGLAIAATGAMLAACAAPPAEPTAAPTEAASDFLPCMVSDTGGFDDNSFNELGYLGLEAAANGLGVDFVAVESTSDADYIPNINSLIDQGCTFIVTVGFALSAATVEAALANPDIEFAIVDDAADNDFDGATDAPNIKPLVFDTAQAAFLAGFAAADFTTSGVVGTFGGMNFPTVAIFMDGFTQGVDYHNAELGSAVTVLGWDRAAGDGTFTGGFAPGPDVEAIAQGLIDQGADILLPVGGPIYQSAVTAIRDSGLPIALIGVDADFTETDPAIADLVFTSILKKIDVAVAEAVTAAGTGAFDPTPFIGTLANGGVGLAPFHDFSSLVRPELQGEIDALAEAIIAGDIVVESYLAG